MDYYIYGLVCPTTGDIRYVGQTININKRLNEHIRSSKNYNTHKANWIKKLLREGLEPTFIILEECLKENVGEREIYWISILREKYVLTNSTDGGEGGSRGRILSKEQRYRISERNKGRKHSEETKKKISEFMSGENSPVRGRVFTKEHRNNLSKSGIGRKHRISTKNKIGESVKGSKNGMSIGIVVKFNGNKQQYGSTRELISATGICYRTIIKYTLSGKEYKGYIFTQA